MKSMQSCPPLSESPAHVQLGDGHGNVVDRESPLQEEILPHVRQGRGRVYGVPPHPVPLQVRRRVTTLQIVTLEKFDHIFLSC